MKSLLFLICMSTMLLACSNKGERTIPLGKMAQIVADMELADKMVREYSVLKRDSVRGILENSLLKVHDISREELDVNLYLYQSDYETYEKLLERIGENYEKKIEEDELSDIPIE